MEKNYLGSFGITPTEEKVYLELLKLGETGMGEIIKRTGLHRGTVYNSVNQLVDKGFVSFNDKNGCRYYHISGKKIFEEIALENKKNIEKEFNNVEDLFKETLEKNNKDEKHKIETFLGVNAFKTLFLEMYDECRDKNIEYLFQGRGGEMESIVGEVFYEYVNNLRKKNNIKCRLLFEEKFRNPKEIETKHVIKKYVKDKIKTPLNLWIYGNTILMVFFEMNPITIIKIKNESLASRFKNYFEELWGQPAAFENQRIYRENLVDLTEGVDSMDILCKDDVAPFFIYPHRIKSFIEYREIIRRKRKTLTGNQDVGVFKAYLKLWKSKAKVRYVVGETGIKEFIKMIGENYGKKELKRYLEELKRNLKKYNVEIKVLKDFNPLTMYISDKGFMVVFPAVKEVYGFMTAGDGIKSTFNKLFEDYWNRSEKIDSYLN